MTQLAIKCYPAIDSAVLLSKQQTLILNGNEVASKHWQLIIRQNHQGFTPHLSAHWFRYIRHDGHEKHYITNDPNQAKRLQGLCDEDEAWSYLSFWL